MEEHIAGEHGGSSIANVLRSRLKIIRLQLNQILNDLSSIFSLTYKSRSKPTEAELLVLLCSIFANDFRIPIQDLVTYRMGLDLFEDDDMFATRCRVHEIILIINDKKYPRKAIGDQIRLGWEKDGPLDEYVKVLAGSRDIAKSVAPRYPLVFRREIVIGEWHESSWYKNCYGLSLVLIKVTAHPVNLEFPNLTLLQLQCREDSQSIPTDFFKSMKKLCVLSLDLPSLPHSLNVLRNLKTLRLKVPKFEDLSWIVGLTKLEFLSISVLSLTDIPSELGQLENLRLLDLRKMNIAYIPPSVLSRLLKLEELYLPLNFRKWGPKAKKYDDFDEWESGEEDNCEDEKRVHATSNEINDGGRINASLIDIVSLPLSALQICVPKASLLPKKSSIFKSIREFNIFLPYNALYQPFGKYSINVLQLTGEACDIKESGICDLLSKVEDLSLTRVRNLRNVIYQLEDSGFPQLKKMAISECNELEYVGETTEKQIQSEGDYLFRKLECLHLSMLSNLKEICHERWTNLRWFSNLSQISIRFCPKLIYVFPLSIVRVLPLKCIEILDCYEMEGIIYEDEEDNIPLTLCSIEKLDLHSLPRLKHFFVHKDDKFDGVKNDINQSLTTNEIVSSSMDGSISTFAKDWKSFCTRENIDDEEIICLPSNSTSTAKAQKGYQQISVIKNKDVVNHMEMCSTFSSRIAVKWFQNLQSLKIAFCDLVKVVFLFEENHDSSKAFNSLEVLELHGLRNLVHTWFQIPPKVTSFKNLQLLVLYECGSSYLFSCRVAKLLVQLQKVYISRCKKMEEIVIGENVENEEQGRIVLPRLKLLEIQHMPNLKILFGVSCEIDLPLLESLKLKQCNKMKSISNGLLKMPMIKCIEVDGSFHLLTKDQSLIFTGLATSHNFTFADLKNATKNFSSHNLLRKEGIATIYRGRVDRKTFSPSKTSTAMLVSIKRYETEVFPYSWVRDRVEREVGILQRRSHPNLVNLLGYCLEDEASFLVYKFIPEGTLYDYLFTGDPRIKPLSWDVRIKTAIGAARGINYLHTSEPQVIHEDIRTDKILLDTDYNSKLADFGLAIWGPSDGNPQLLSTNCNAKIFDVDFAKVIRFGQSEEIGRSVGTNAYIAPEMFKASDYHSVETDVYSFGVVLLELMTGLKVSQLHQKCQEDQQLSLAKWLKLYLSKERELKDIVDSSMSGRYSSYEILLMANLTLKCTEDDPKLRPTMGEVLQKLQEIYAIQQKHRQ